MPQHLLSYYKQVAYIALLHSRSGKKLGRREIWMKNLLKKKNQTNQLLGNHNMKLSNLQLTSCFWTQLHEHCSHCHSQPPITVQVRLNITVKRQIWALLKFWVSSTYNPGDLDKKFICILLVNICLNPMTWFGSFYPEYRDSVRENIASGHLSTYLAGEGPNNSWITAAKSYHEDHSLRWVSWDLSVFHMHSLIHPWTALTILFSEKGIFTCPIMSPVDH